VVRTSFGIATGRALVMLALCCALLPANSLAAGTLANGHGQIVDSAPPDGDFYSFSFKAHGDTAGAADGAFSLANPDRGFSMTGAVDCLKVVGDDAVLSGVITSQQGVGPGTGGVGDNFLAFIGDARGPQTTFSPFIVQGNTPGLCLQASQSGGSPLVRGQIVVKG